MEQNEMFEDNGFENFEDQNRYRSLSALKEKQANIIGIISMMFYGSGFILLLIGNKEELAHIGAGCWGISLMTAVIGYKIKKTKITEMMILGTLWLLGMGIMVGTLIFIFVYLLTGAAFM